MKASIKVVNVLIFDGKIIESTKEIKVSKMALTIIIICVVYNLVTDTAESETRIYAFSNNIQLLT